ncbi:MULTISPECIES: hypothetical protein [Flavobacterium]|uniref:Uncharacterized protein n=1 Tax=Flavobacterium endoglycinae TaxID=2816357 RepID=A0ABX7QCK2_9FLAO|nr:MULTISPECIES: hypothetical protein [Flavobacterium]QSW88363.1 hypothetical protein J0383_19165 [Flavobacterium endoglycinae]
MKNNLYKIGLVFMISLFTSFLFVSCSNDDFENEENAISKIKIQAESGTQVLDSTKVKSVLSTESDGDPSNPKPPRR